MPSPSMPNFFIRGMDVDFSRSTCRRGGAFKPFKHVSVSKWKLPWERTPEQESTSEHFSSQKQRRRSLFPWQRLSPMAPVLLLAVFLSVACWHYTLWNSAAHIKEQKKQTKNKKQDDAVAETGSLEQQRIKHENKVRCKGFKTLSSATLLIWTCT